MLCLQGPGFSPGGGFGGQTARSHHGHLYSTTSLSKVVQKRSVSSGSSRRSSFGWPTGTSTPPDTDLGPGGAGWGQLGLGDQVVEDTSSSPVGPTPALVSRLSPPGTNGWRNLCRRGCARNHGGGWGSSLATPPPVAPSSSTGSARFCCGSEVVTVLQLEAYS